MVMRRTLRPIRTINRFAAAADVGTTTLEDVSQLVLHEAADGVEALSIARRARPALVFLDVDMPRLGGIDACRELRESPETGDATIVMLTATHGASVERRAARRARTCSSPSRSARSISSASPIG
jgi:CheY-like chemotaxis protein